MFPKPSASSELVIMQIRQLREDLSSLRVTKRNVQRVCPRHVFSANQPL